MYYEFHGTQKTLIIYLSPIQNTVYTYANAYFFMDIIFVVNLMYTKLSVRISSVFYHTFHTYFFIYIYLSKESGVMVDHVTEL